MEFENRENPTLKAAALIDSNVTKKSELTSKSWPTNIQFGFLRLIKFRQRKFFELSE